jgi:predicted nucleic acid-binding protein
MVGDRKSLFERLGKPADKYHILEEKLLYKGQDVKTCRESVAPKRLEWTQTLKIFFELATPEEYATHSTRQPPSRIIAPTERHWSILRELLMPLGTAANLTSDAHLAALAIEHGARLFSTDNDFSRFATLRWTNPI